jgi:hypothetical protein
MKFKKIALLLFLAVFSAILFYACSETTSSTNTPVIDKIAPTTGVPGDVVTITGSNFGDYSQTTSKVYFGDVIAQIKVEGTDVQWTSDEIKAVVPQGASTGLVTVDVNGTKSNGFTFTVPSVSPPLDLQATSKSNTAVMLKWTASPDESKAGFDGYTLFITPKGGVKGNPIAILKGTYTFIATNLIEGTVYDFDLHASSIYNGQTMLSSAANVKWSPATRFIENVNSAMIKIYESPSTFGSGLQLYDAVGGAPKTLKVANGINWDLGLYTTDGTVTFGSAKTILDKYSSFTGTAKKCEISNVKSYVTSLDEVFDSFALDATKHTYSEQAFDLSAETSDKNIVFIVRTNSPDWNYAKVMIIYNGGYLQNDGTDNFIEAQVSFQKVKGVPYAF